MKLYYLVAAAAFVTVPAIAQDADPLPIQAYLPPAASATVVPANTQITLKMNQEVTTKGQSWSEGDTFELSVVHDVLLDAYIVIPRGTRAVGRITWLTSKGAFGKSGKMDVELEYMELGGRRIPINGTYRQEGEGNTVATVGGVIAVGVFAGFITGKSARIPQGREMTATLEGDLAVNLPTRNVTAAATPLRVTTVSR